MDAAFLGFCLLGLGVWDKALGLWMLGGISVAALVVFPRRLWALASRKHVAAAFFGFVLGVLPLFVFNVENHWATFAGNVRRDLSDLPGKARMLMETAKGDGLFGWMFDEEWQTPAPHPPSGIIERASARISSLAGHPRRHLLFDAFLLAVLLTPLARGGALRGILFGIIALAVAWIQMATNAGTGGSVHHTILLWPLPQLVVALSFAAASRRLGLAGLPVLAVVTVAMIIPGVLVTNEYFYTAYRFGGTPVWSDAIFPLADFLKSNTGNVYCADWGMFDGLRYLSHGKLKLAEGTGPISNPDMTPANRQAGLHMLNDPGSVIVAHTKEFENFQGTRDRLLKFAAAEGYQCELLAVIPDHFGRQAFEIYRFTAPVLQAKR